MNRMLSSGLSCLLLLALGACGSKPKPKVQQPVAVSKATHGLRIEQAVVVPVRYKATLGLDPSMTRFSGELASDVSVIQSSNDFYLNGHGLAVSKATLVTGGQAIALHVAAEEEEWLHFTAPVELPLGPATLHVTYEGDISSDSSFGIFRQEAAGDWYLFTQFEARGARRAFPSFDQPDLKVPWQLSLEVPEGLVALTNTPEIARKAIGQGRVRVDFAESPPLPSYLVAFAVGAFDMVEVGKTRSGVPVRVAAPRGRGGETGWVKESTLPLIEILEDYTGIAYPYAKLDLVSIPSTGSFGAMENAGLITYTETLLLSKDNDLNFKKGYASVGAHELAHQWFGNLVTNAWWDDLWLNESFATWAAAKVVSKFNPEWRSDLSWIDRRNGAMGADRLSTARVIHQPIETEGDIGSAFDGITYAKGASVLTMFEGWLGEETFRRGIQHYLGNNQWKSLVAKDFLDAMDVGTGAAVSGAFTTFIDNPGTPVVEFDLTCEAGKEPVLSLSQQRYKPLGSQISDSPDYKIPLCVRYPGADKKNPELECSVLSEKTSQMPLTRAVGCPAWVVPNAGATGYYRSKLSETLLSALLAKAPLTVPEQLVLASDLKALVYAGGAPIESMLALVPRMAASEDDGLVGTAADLSGLGRLVVEADQPRYKAWLTKNFGKRARRLGWKASPSEAPSRTSLRSTLLALMVFDAGDMKLRTEGQALAKAWLAEPGSVNPDLAELALQVGARFGDAALLDQYVAAIKGTSDRSRRRLLLQGLGAVTEPGLVEHALRIMLDPEIDVRESQRMLASIAADKDSGHLAFAFVQSNFDALSKRYGEEMGTRLSRVASSQCDESHSDSVQQFLREKIEPMEGGKRSAEQALEGFVLCLAARKHLSLPAKL